MFVKPSPLPKPSFACVRPLVSLFDFVVASRATRRFGNSFGDLAVHIRNGVVGESLEDVLRAPEAKLAWEVQVLGFLAEGVR